MSDEADYVPWTVLHDVKVLTLEEGNHIWMELPYVAAESGRAIIKTAEIVARIGCKTLLKNAKQNQKELQIANLRSLKFEPPYVRFHCEDCEETWDAWVADDGSLEDQWSCVCTNGNCASHGAPATLLELED